MNEQKQQQLRQQHANRIEAHGRYMLARSAAILAKGHTALPDRDTFPLFAQVVDAMKCEVLADMASGRVPGTVTTFSELHDHVDANEYGGFCDEDNGPFGGFINASWFMWFTDAAQCEVDKWLKAVPPRGLYCTCCGERFEGRHWWNQDFGHGLCPACWVRITEKGTYTPDEMLRSYGHYGYHCILPRDSEVLAEQPTL